MTIHRRVIAPVVALAAAAALALSACTDAAEPTPAPPSESPTGTPTPEPTAAPTDPGGGPAPVEPLPIDWTDPDAVVELDNGWEVRHCEGDAPLLCVSDGGPVLGIVEAMRSPLGEELAGILDADGLEAALAHHVAGYHAAFAADRAEGCGPDYTYVELPTRTVTLAGSPALRYGFSGVVAGVEVERNVGYVTVAGGQLQLVTAAANQEDSCVFSDEFQEFRPAALVELEPYLDAIAAGSVLPSE